MGGSAVPTRGPGKVQLVGTLNLAVWPRPRSEVLDEMGKPLLPHWVVGSAGAEDSDDHDDGFAMVLLDDDAHARRQLDASQLVGAFANGDRAGWAAPALPQSSSPTMANSRQRPDRRSLPR